MTHRTVPGVTWEGLLQLLLEKFEIPSMDEFDRLKQRLDRLENIIFRQNMIGETTGITAANLEASDIDASDQEIEDKEAEDRNSLDEKPLEGDRPEQDTEAAPKKNSKRKSSPKKKRSFDSDFVLKAITDEPDGTDFKTIMAKTKYEDKKLRNIIYRLDRTGKIKKVKRGVYKKI